MEKYLNEEIKFVFESANRVLEASKRNEESIDKQVKKANQITHELSKAIDNLNYTKIEINESIEDTLNQNSKKLQEKLQVKS